MALNKISATIFTRPADTTAYAAGDLIANSTTAGSVVPLSFRLPTSGKNATVQGIVVQKSATSLTNFSTTLHLFDASPTVAGGDNAAPAPSAAGYLGSISTATTSALAGTGVAWATNSSDVSTKPTFVVPASRTVYGLLTATGAYTPASEETFTVSIVVDINK